MFLDNTFLYKLFIDVNTVIYNLINWSYQIFLTLAKTNVFSDDVYLNLVSKAYVVIGVFMLFFIAYNFVTYIADPDSKKGGKEVIDLLKKLGLSLGLIILCPTIFSYAYKLQNVILESNIIMRFINNKSVEEEIDPNSAPDPNAAKGTIESSGTLMTYNVFTMFFRPSSNYDASEIFATVETPVDLSTSGSNAGSVQYTTYNFDENIKYVDKNGKGRTSKPNLSEHSSEWNNYSIYVSKGRYVKANTPITYHLPDSTATCALKYNYIAVSKLIPSVHYCYYKEPVVEKTWDYNIYNVKFGEVISSTKTFTETISLAEAYKRMKEGHSYFFLSNFKKSVANDEIEYHPLLALVAGVLILYVVASFCFDIGLRIVKLIFYQVVSPICITCNISPKTETVYKNWVKATIQTYLSVFLRVFILALNMYLISTILTSNLFSTLWDNSDTAYWLKCISELFLIMGIITFIKQSPKLIEDIFGASDLKLGLKDTLQKMQAGGLLTAGAMVGAGVTTGVRNLTNIGKSVRNTQAGKGRKLNATLRGLASVPGGMIGGALRGIVQGAKASSFKDMVAASGKAAADSVNARNRRATARSAHDQNGLGSALLIGDILAAADNGQRRWRAVEHWAGIDNLEELEAQKNTTDEIFAAVDDVDNTIKAKLEELAVKHKFGKFFFGMKDNAGHTRRDTSLHNACAKATNALDFSIESLAYLDDKIKDASSTPDGVDATALGLGKFTRSELESIRGLFLKNYQNQIKEVAFQSAEHFSQMQAGAGTNRTWSDDEKSAFAMIAAKASTARQIIRDNLGNPIITQANYEATNARNGGQLLSYQTINDDLTITHDSALDRMKSAHDYVVGEITKNIGIQKSKQAKDKK